MFVVFLDSQEVHCPIGVHDFERKEGVNLYISVQVTLNWHVGLDDLDHTVDYTSLVDIVNEQAAIERQLLESLAIDIQAAILAKSPSIIEKIHIRIVKPAIPHFGYAASACGIEYTFSNQ
jgi:dihydroneopterin aldolase